MYFGHTVKDGITGVVMKPIRGAKRDGVTGFVKGVGQGVVGLVAAPVSGETTADKQPYAAAASRPNLGLGFSDRRRDFDMFARCLAYTGLVRCQDGMFSVSPSFSHSPEKQEASNC